MNIKNVQIILASASPRRRELLEQVGLNFQVVPAKGEEHITSNVPEEVVRKLAHDKAMEVAGGCKSGCLIIGADTVVAAGGRILGKPADKTAAADMIKELRNSCHSVFTGVTIVHIKDNGCEVLDFAEETKVSVGDISDEEIDMYIATGEPMDKAGAYGIQGLFAQYVTGICGDYYNVVGLPVSRLLYEIKGMEE